MEQQRVIEHQRMQHQQMEQQRVAEQQRILQQQAEQQRMQQQPHLEGSRSSVNNFNGTMYGYPQPAVPHPQGSMMSY